MLDFFLFLVIDKTSAFGRFGGVSEEKRVFFVE